MRNIILASAILIGISASAQQRKISASDYRGSSSSMHAVSGAFGFYSPGASLLIDTSKAAGSQSASPAVSGFFGIGGDYEYLYSNDLTFGGFFRYYSTSDSISSTTEQKVSAWTISGMARAY